MKKVVIILVKLGICLLGSVFILAGLVGLITCFTEDQNLLVLDIIFTIIFFGLGIFLFIVNKLIGGKETSPSLNNYNIQNQSPQNIPSGAVKYDTATPVQNQTSAEQLQAAQELLNSSANQLNKMFTSGSAVNVTVQNTSTAYPKEVLDSMRTAYSPMQAQGDIRVLNDCISLMQTTNNLETFFSRYELALQKVMTLEQAKNAGIAINTPITSTYVMSLKNRADCVLQSTYAKELKEIDALKTPVGKRNRIDKFISFLSEYQDEFEFSDAYRHIISDLNLLKKEL